MKRYLDGPLGVAPDLTHGCRKENCQDQKGTLGRRTLRTEVRAKFDKGPLSGNLMFLFCAPTVITCWGHLYMFGAICEWAGT